METLSPSQRQARLFRNGTSQAVRIPREFEFAAKAVAIHKEGDRVILEPIRKHKDLLALLASLEPIDDEFPDIDDMPPLDDIKF